MGPAFILHFQGQSQEPGRLRNHTHIWRKVLELQILPDIFTLPGEECEQGQDEAAPSGGAFEEGIYGEIWWDICCEREPWDHDGQCPPCAEEEADSREGQSLPQSHTAS